MYIPRDPPLVLHLPTSLLQVSNFLAHLSYSDTAIATVVSQLYKSANITLLKKNLHGDLILPSSRQILSKITIFSQICTYGMYSGHISRLTKISELRHA